MFRFLIFQVAERVDRRHARSHAERETVMADRCVVIWRGAVGDVEPRHRGRGDASTAGTTRGQRGVSRFETLVRPEQSTRKANQLPRQDVRDHEDVLERCP